MFKNYDRRGSVLLMVVGLLVILGTLGGTFLLVSSLDARQARLLAGRGRAELIASGGVGQIVRLLSEDLHFDASEASSPYTAENITGAEAYKFYMDYRGSVLDRHLFSSDGGTQPSNILGEGLGDSHLVSTEDDEGGDRDSYLIPTGEFSDEGEQYHVSFKVVDLGSLLALNTGGYDYIGTTTDTSKILKSPALIDLKNWLGGDYNKIHSERCGGAAKTLMVYDPQCGRRLLSPVEHQGYMPFAIADEVYLRWMGSGRKANFGRVFEELDGGSGGSASKRQLLTTINSSRSITRSPISKVIASRIDLSEIDALDSDGKQGLYSQIIMIAGSEDGKGGGLSKGAARIIDNSAAGFYASRSWRPTSMTSSYSSKNKRMANSAAAAWWVFKDLPQSTYKVWVTWGTNTSKPPAVNVPYRVYTGGAASGTSYSGGNLQRTFIANQTVQPATTINGHRWQSMGQYTLSGTLAIEIQGPQGVPEGESQFAFADAVLIEGVGIDLGSGSKPAAHLTANTWAAMSEDTAENTGKAFPFRPSGKDWTVFGVRQQPFITEAFATHTTRTITQSTTANAQPVIDENSWKWGAAIEIMNFSPNAIDLSGYRLAFEKTLGKDTELHAFPAGSVIPKASATSGGRLVVYDFKAGNAAVKAKDVFGVAVTAWKQVEGLNFDNQTVRLVQVATKKPTAEGGGNGTVYNIPIDHIEAGDKDTTNTLEYPFTTEEVKTLAPPTAVPGKSLNETTTSNCRRDDSVSRQRYAVAKYWRPAKPTVTIKDAPEGTPPGTAITADSHKLAVANAIDTGKLPTTAVKEGFRTKMKYGLLSGPGALSDLYLAGPVIFHDEGADGDTPSATIPPADLPELLAKEYAVAESRGRANSHVKNTSDSDYSKAPWNKYPRFRDGKALAWPVLLSEIIETVPMDLQRGDSPGRVYGRVNVNTAGSEVLRKLPWPPGVNAGTAASRIIDYRTRNKGFVTPGEIALALDGLGGANKDLDRDAIYAAISSCTSISSDMYAVTIRVQLGPNTNESRAWFYVAVIDRGCAVFSTDKPAVLLFTQVK
ncbi:MAG: hypothetical protein QGG42_00610 [Phycisphaerae bacterium]|jgi:hypothetical protein|nr:hypothetical protein [Phycisphaerae bacterium]